MKKRVNLLLKKRSYQNLERILKGVKGLSLILVIFTFISLFVLLLLKNIEKQHYQKLQTQKESLLESILKRKNTEQQALYFNQKSSLINLYLQNDVNFLAYYKELQNYLPLASTSASIDKIDYDSKHNFKMVIKIDNYSTFYNYLTYIQNPQFLNIFETLKLDSFTINEAHTNNYNLSLSGRFKPITK